MNIKGRQRFMRKLKKFEYFCKNNFFYDYFVKIKWEVMDFKLGCYLIFFGENK